MADEPDTAGPPGDVSGPPTGRDLSARDFIAEHLRAMFREADREPLPAALQALLDRLAREEDR